MADKKEIRVRFGKGETGWATRVSSRRAKIANIPMTGVYNFGDVVALGPVKDGFYTLGHIVKKNYSQKALLEYRKPYMRNFQKLGGAFRIAGCEVEGWTEGMCGVAYNATHDLLKIAANAGVFVTVKETVDSETCE